MMNPAASRLVPALAAAAVAYLSAGCTDRSVWRPGERLAAAPITASTPERRAAIAEMRAKGEAGEAAAFPEVFQEQRMTELAARPEPRAVADVAAIEAELAAIARQRERAQSPAALASLEARAAELRRLAAAAQAGSIRP